MCLKAAITNISRGSLHDGTGVRTVVYFKGCGLKCAWCHNPETLSPAPEILYTPTKCMHCARCLSVCPEHHKIAGNDMVFLRDGCSACGKCADACPTGALSLCGTSMTVEEVMNQIRKDRHYYMESGGGVTLSGGECLLRPDFCRELLSMCKREGITTAIETALYVPWTHVEAVLPYVDHIFADVKLPDAARHKKYTGQDNALILENLNRLSRAHDSVTLRIPLIPGVNDSVSDMAAFADIIKGFGRGATSVELLKYNFLAASKYDMAGRKYIFFGNEAQNNEHMEILAGALSRALGDQTNVFFRK